MPTIKVTSGGEEAEAWMQDPLKKLLESEAEAASLDTELPSIRVPLSLDAEAPELPHMGVPGQRQVLELPESPFNPPIGADDPLKATMDNWHVGVQSDLRRIEQQLTGDVETLRQDFEGAQQNADDRLTTLLAPDGVGRRPHLEFHLEFSGPTKAWMRGGQVYLNGTLLDTLTEEDHEIDGEHYCFVRYVYETDVLTLEWDTTLPGTDYTQYIKRLCRVDDMSTGPLAGELIDADGASIWHEGEINLDVDIPDSHSAELLSNSLQETGPEHIRSIYDFPLATGTTGPLTYSRFGSGHNKFYVMVRKDAYTTGPTTPTVKYATIGTGPQELVTNVYLTGPAGAPSVRQTKITAYVLEIVCGPWDETVLTAGPCPTGP